MLNKFGKPISRETAISPDTGILVVAPCSKPGLRAAQSIKKAFESIGLKVSVLDDPEHNILLDSKQPVIALGNLADSKCVKYLYYKFLCITDKSYPGKKGYNIRTIVNPFKTGQNVIHIGYSDNEGLVQGINAFLSKVKNPLPYFNDVFYTRLPYEDEYIENIKNTKLPEKMDLIPSIHTSYWWLIGFACYATGDMKPFKTYLDGWRKMIELSRKNANLIKGTHLYMTRIIENWRLLEYSGMIPDNLRGEIEKCIYDWAESSEGKKYAASHTGGKILPSHNHTMFCGLSLLYASDYFSKRYPKLKEPNEWKKFADNVFFTFNHGGWKPYCDDSSYSNRVSLPLVCMYSIFKDNHIFLDTAGRKVSKWLKAIIGQNGIMPSFGDGTVKSPFPFFIAGLYSHYYNDGEMLYLLKRFLHNTNKKGMGFERRFDSGVIPSKTIDNPTISSIPLDRYMYDVWDVNPDAGKRLAGMPPKGPYEQCFDKVSIRTGWNECKDDFLLIDGLGSSGVHAYNDAMGILDYTSKGLVWLVEENCYRWPEPENCSILTISKDGYASEMPGYALMEEQKIIGKDQIYIRMRLKDYNETDWVREVYLIKGLCVIVHDTVIPKQKGKYVINAHFRTPAKARIEKNTMKSERKDSNGSEYELRLSAYGSTDVNITLNEIAFGKKLFTYGGMHDDKKRYNPFTSQASTGVAMWEKRYNNNDIVISSMNTSISSHLDKGEKVSFTHIVHPAKKKDADLSFKIIGNKMHLEYKKDIYNYPLAHVGMFSKKEHKTHVSYNKPQLNKYNKLKHNIKNIISVEENMYLYAMEDGNIALYNNKEKVWIKALEGEIHAMEYIKPENILVIGHGNNQLTALDLKGVVLWDKKIKRIPTLYDNWELEYPKIVKVTYFQNNAGTVIVTGCGDNHVRLFTIDGEMINALYIYATVPDVIEIVDIDGDGVLEILAAGSDEGAHGIFYVYDVNGNPKKNISVGFWLCNIKSHQITCENNKYTLVCGMKYLDNFKILEILNGNVKVVSQKRLGGTVNSVKISENNGNIYSGTSKGSVLAFDEEGTHLWHTHVEDSVKELFIDDKVIAVCENGKVSVLSSNGIIQSSTVLPSNITCCIKINNLIYIGSERYVYKLDI